MDTRTLTTTLTEAMRRAIPGSHGRRQSELRKELRQLTIPILVETLLVMTLGAMDTFMLSRYNDESVAAVGVVNQVIALCFIVFEVINLGTSVLCSQYLGARRRDRMEEAVGVSLIVNLLSGLTVSSGLYIFAPQILKLMGLDAALINLGAGYMKIVGGFAFVQALAMTVSAVLRSNNRATLPMIVILVVNIMNIIGNYIFIFGKFGMPALGVNGAALSTVIARIVAMTVLFVMMFRTTIRRFPWRIFRRFPKEEFLNLMKIGLPAAGEQMSYNMSQLVITFFIASLGMEALAARTYCFNIIMYSYLFCIAVSHAGAIVVGHLVGARRSKGAYLMGVYVMKVAMAVTLLFSIILALASREIMTMLTSNAEIISLGVAILWIDVVLEIGRPVNIVFVNLLQGAGDVNYPFYVGLIFMWTIAVGMAWVFGIAAGFGIIGMWWMFALDENVRGAVFIHRWRSKKWMQKGFV